jgi:acyl-CoA reductase-like NAD-dependent aldehyde dehydrogenase
MELNSWRNRSPGDLSVVLPEIIAGDPAEAVDAAKIAATAWAKTPLAERSERLQRVQRMLDATRERLAEQISIETGKPLTEARFELDAVITKIDLTIADANDCLAERSAPGGPHAALVRRRPRGPAAVIGPFNFPLHLGHGAVVAHLIAGNPVIFKPSPLAASVAAEYGAIMASAFPSGVFQLLQGGAAEGEALCLDPRIRSVCFTGSIPVGRALAKAVAEDYSKDLALELGGSNSVIVCADADLEKAAMAVAEGACLTAGQRCNATSRVIVEKPVARDFQRLLLAAFTGFRPGDPLLPATKLGPLISAAAAARYDKLLAETPGEWLLPGGFAPEVGGKRGYYVHPAVIHRAGSYLADSESFVPILSLQVAPDLDEAVRLQNATVFGLTASIFTSSRERFQQIGDQLLVGNLYANLPTTFSPSTLPFGGLRDSGNGHPGGRGFVRFTTNEQAVQWTGFGE